MQIYTTATMLTYVLANILCIAVLRLCLSVRDKKAVKAAFDDMILYSDIEYYTIAVTTVECFKYLD